MQQQYILQHIPPLTPSELPVPYKVYTSTYSTHHAFCCLFSCSYIIRDGLFFSGDRSPESRAQVCCEYSRFSMHVHELHISCSCLEIKSAPHIPECTSPVQEIQTAPPQVRQTILEFQQKLPAFPSIYRPDSTYRFAERPHSEADSPPRNKCPPSCESRC
jgi:hypothetical protein